MNLDPQIPDGPIAEKWQRHLFEMKLVDSVEVGAFVEKKS